MRTSTVRSKRPPRYRAPIVAALALSAAGLTALVQPISAQQAPSSASAQPARQNKANWVLSNKFTGTALTSLTYSTSVTPHWIGQSDSLWYTWKDHVGCSFYLVVPKLKTKMPLFDHAKLAEQLSMLRHKPYDPTLLPFDNVTFSKDAKTFTFMVDSNRYEWNVASQTLIRATVQDSAAGGRGRGGAGAGAVGRGGRGNGGRGGGAGAPGGGNAPCGGGGRGGAGAGGAAGGAPTATCPGAAPAPGGGGGRGGRGGGGAGADVGNYSPDSTKLVFARNHNLFLVYVARHDTIQLSKDGAQNHSFGGNGPDTSQNQQQDEQNVQQNEQQGGAGASSQPVRAAAVWSPDSKWFYIQRQDTRKVADLYLIDVLSCPRPEVVSYKYAMPGEENVTQHEFWVWHDGDTQVHVPVKFAHWKDQDVYDISWEKGADKVRMVRRDRLQRNMEYVELDLTANTSTVLIEESVENANLERQSPRYVNKQGDFIWWSKRSGWGHYYLYDHTGKLKNAITSGDWRADAIVELDSVKRVAYISGVGREPGENPYYVHLYRVNLDGTGFTLLDPGNATHTVTAGGGGGGGGGGRGGGAAPANPFISPSHHYFVDNSSRVDMVPKAVINDEFGKPVMELETEDMTRLTEMGFRPAVPFQVKAADGFTDIYGTMYKPFDFDSTKKYPIIANVYPGPQTESITFNFTTGGVPQRLANLGFIVIQIGNRGGSPERSDAYQSFSYFNMRDYALPDKKAGIEQLAARYKWIDIDKVGIYGHSGGGFLTAAAMMLPPYNEFFKVGVSSSGNHDNNVYNQNWSEQYYGLTELKNGVRVDGPPVVVADASATTGVVAATGRGGNGGGRGGNGGGRGGGGRGGGGRGANAAAADSTAAVVQQGGAAPPNPADSVTFMIHIPTNAELAANLKGDLLLAHGDMDNNVHPAGTIRLMDALIHANKRFDFILLPGKPHAYGDDQEYFNQRMMEYFAEHLLGDYYRDQADMKK